MPSADLLAQVTKVKLWPDVSPVGRGLESLSLYRGSLESSTFDISTRGQFCPRNTLAIDQNHRSVE